METRLVPQHGIELDTIAVKGLARQGHRHLARRAVAADRCAAGARCVRRKRRARVVSFGGYAAGPAGSPRASPVCRCWCTNRTARRADQPRAVESRAPVLVGFQTFAGEEVVATRCATEIAAIAPPRSASPAALARRCACSCSAAARARALERRGAAGDRIVAWNRFDIRHQCGEKMLDDARKAYADAGVAASVEPFIADMAAAYAWPIVVCRAGALTWPNSAPPASAACWCRSRRRSTTTRPATPNTWSNAARRCCSRRTPGSRTTSGAGLRGLAAIPAPFGWRGRARHGETDAAEKVADAVQEAA